MGQVDVSAGVGGDAERLVEGNSEAAWPSCETLYGPEAPLGRPAMRDRALVSELKPKTLLWPVPDSDRNSKPSAEKASP